jgi:hypothetical protein
MMCLVSEPVFVNYPYTCESTGGWTTMKVEILVAARSNN